MDKNDLINFENRLADRFDEGELPYLVHLSGGNEDQLLEIFKEIRPSDYVFSTHRNHYHYLLHGGPPERLEQLVLNGKSMFVFDRMRNFFSSSIVAGNVAIAVGVAWALKRKSSSQKVWCFVGDGAEDEGHFYEAVRYVDGWNLPCTFVIEDNNRSVSAPKNIRWGDGDDADTWLFHPCVMRYCYTPTWPHGGNGRGKWLQFKKEAIVPMNHQRKDFNWSYDSVSQPMKYKDAVRLSMNKLAELGAIFIGYNVKYGAAYETLKDVPDEQKVETPVAENLMAGLAMGMSLEGFRPVLFFERHDFIFNASDALINHIGMVELLSDGQFVCPVIIRAVAGSVKPFYAGPTHTSDLTETFQHMFPFPVCAPKTSSEVLGLYDAVIKYDRPILISELKDLYERT